MAEKVNYKALIKFSETSRTAILDVNELFNISTNDIYSTNIIFDENNDEYTITLFQFLINLYFLEFNFMFKIPITKDWLIIAKNMVVTF